jgi:hypothetical protein
LRQHGKVDNGVAQCKDLDVAYTRRVEAREAVRAEANAASVQAALCRLFPLPCHSRYVALTLLPQKPLLDRMVRCLDLAASGHASCCFLPCCNTLLASHLPLLRFTFQMHDDGANLRQVFNAF